jgi:integrase
MAKVGKLTAKFIETAGPGTYADGGNLYLQIAEYRVKSGEMRRSKSWLFRYMLNGVSHDMGLGSLDTFTMKEARERARGMRQLLVDGIDPLEKRHEAKQAVKIEAARTITFKDAAQRYIKAHEAGWKNSKHRQQWTNTLVTYAYPLIGDLPVSAIDTGMVMKILEPIWQKKTETASRVRSRLETVLGWATVRGYRKGDNPARWKGHLSALLPKKAKVAKVRHQPAMPYAELPAFMDELSGNSAMSARALEFTVLTAVRTSEAIEAKWDEIDLEARLWTVPGERMKAGREHRVPLCDRAVKLLKALPREKGSPYVFIGARARKPLSNMAMLQLLRGMRPGLTVHGFRSSFRDWAAECTNFPRELAESALGHVLANKVEAAYQRGDLLEKRRRLMDAWAAYCTKPAGNGAVIPMRKGA